MNIAIILAGGIGSRMGMKSMPKQFIDVYGKPILVHTIEAFDNHHSIDYIVVVTLENYIDHVRGLCRKYDLNKVKHIISGGKTRQESVLNGLNEISDHVNDEDIIIIHDSVRPLINSRIISDNIKMANEFGATDTVIPSSDTIIKSIDSQNISSVPIRKELFLGQTPQSFKFNILMQAHQNAQKNSIKHATDDCQLVIEIGKEVKLVLGDKLNFKITSPEDLAILKALVKLGN